MPTLILYTYSHKYMLTCHTSPGLAPKTRRIETFFFQLQFTISFTFPLYLAGEMASHAPLALFQKGFLPKSKTFLFLFYTINVAHVYTIYHIHTVLYTHIQRRVFFYQIILLHFYTTWPFLKTRHCITVHMIICCLTCFWSTILQHNIIIIIR